MRSPMRDIDIDIFCLLLMVTVGAHRSFCKKRKQVKSRARTFRTFMHGWKLSLEGRLKQ